MTLVFIANLILGKYMIVLLIFWHLAQLAIKWANYYCWKLFWNILKFVSFPVHFFLWKKNLRAF